MRKLTEAEREREVDVEVDFLADGIARTKEAQERNDLADTMAGRTVLRETIGKLIPAIEAEQNAVERGARKLHGVALVALDAEKLAYITLRVILTAFAETDAKVPVTRLARQIGQCCWLERAHDTLRGRARNVLESLVRRNKNPWNAKKRAQKKFVELNGSDWGNGDLGLRIGASLLKLAVRHAGLLAKFSRYKEPSWVELAEDARSRLEGLLREQEWLATPLRLPMIVPPRKWEGTKNGGYFMVLDLPLVKKLEDAAADEPLRGEDVVVACEAVNALQETPWRLNRRVLPVLRRAWESKDPSLPSLDFRKLPPPMDGNPARKRERAIAYEANRAAAAQTVEMRSRLNIARYFENEKELFYPHQLDHRGRAYPLPQKIHPQADDIGRAMIEFAQGKLLGEKGARWLAIHLANLFGLSKHPFGERIAWAEENRAAIIDSAVRPLEGARFWTKADKPWRFLAAAFEWADYGMSGPAAESHVPVAMDGTCNGHQHLSALGRDPEGGFWTNLVASERPKDIYQAVADRLAVAVAGTAGPLARRWEGIIDRKLVKPATMTTPYGVTTGGIQKQLIAQIRERFQDRFESEGTAAAFLTPLLEAAIAGIAVKSAEISLWLRAVVTALASKGLGLRWRVPTGFPVRHLYRVERGRRIRTAMGTLLLLEPDDTPGRLDVEKQGDAIVPNLVHSLDAAHMMMTVRELHARGLRDFSMVHDSFAVHACDVDVMNAVLREEFVRIHNEFTLAGFANQVRKDFPGAAISDPPALGSLELGEVRRSDYFFA